MSDHLIFIDTSIHNVGESEKKNDKYTGKVLVHDFDWQKAISKGVVGAIIKEGESYYGDQAYETVMGSCPLYYRGTYHYVGYTKKHYVVGNEIGYADQQTQKIISQVDKFRSKINIKISLDYEQNANWEPIVNTPEDRVIDRANKILLRICTNIKKNEGYWPILYINRHLTSTLNKNFVGCPLWIAVGNEIIPTINTSATPNSYKINYWQGWAIRQVWWTAPGKEWGNFTGNPVVDVNWVENLQAILINPNLPGAPAGEPETPQSEDEPVMVKKIRVTAILGLVVRSSAAKTDKNDTGKKLAFGTERDVLEEATDAAGNLWVRVEEGWICRKWGIWDLAKFI